MSIWGHDIVHIVKDTDKHCWVVHTPPPVMQQLVTIPWVDAFKGYTTTHAPDYVEAIDTCQSDATTRLTRAEEAWARRELEPKPVPTAEPTEILTSDNVLKISDFKRRR